MVAFNTDAVGNVITTSIDTAYVAKQSNKCVKIYVVTAYRWGDKECHSYVVGAFDNLEIAIQHAKAEKEWRGNKYDCEVVSMNLNESDKLCRYNVEYKIPDYN